MRFFRTELGDAAAVKFNHAVLPVGDNKVIRCVDATIDNDAIADEADNF